MPSVIDPKPEKPYRATKEEWAEWHTLLLRGAVCGCGCGRPANSLHHLVGRDQGGDDDPMNLFPLAGGGTTLCHGAVQYGQRTYDMKTKTYCEPDEVARGIRRGLNPFQKAYIIKKKGEYWLDRVYPDQ